MSTLELTRQISDLRPVLQSFTSRFTTDRDESLDLVQDTILRALMNVDKFRHHSNLKGWLFTIMRNTFINQYRKTRHARISRDQTKDLYHLNAEDTNTFHRPASAVEYNDTLNQINTIRKELLVPFNMHMAGYKYHEIAAHEKIPVGTVKNRIFHARKEIQKMFSSC